MNVTGRVAVCTVERVGGVEDARRRLILRVGQRIVPARAVYAYERPSMVSVCCVTASGNSLPAGAGAGVGDAEGEGLGAAAISATPSSSGRSFQQVSQSPLRRGRIRRGFESGVGFCSAASPVVEDSVSSRVGSAPDE